MSQGPPNPEFMQEKVQKCDFPKKPFQELHIFWALNLQTKLLSKHPDIAPSKLNAYHLLLGKMKSGQIWLQLHMDDVT